MINCFVKEIFLYKSLFSYMSFNLCVNTIYIYTRKQEIFKSWKTIFLNVKLSSRIFTPLWTVNVILEDSTNQRAAYFTVLTNRSTDICSVNPRLFWILIWMCWWVFLCVLDCIHLYGFKLCLCVLCRCVFVCVKFGIKRLVYLW